MQPSMAPSLIPRRPFASTEDLTAAVDDYLSSLDPFNSSAVLDYGYPIGTWNVGRIQVFDKLFSADRNTLAAAFNEPLHYWDMSKATSLADMFYGKK